jgi:hypothetical protein
VVERILGKAEVVSSILTGSTIRAESEVTVAQRLLAERAFDATSDHVTEPDDASQQDDRKCKLKRVDHESNLRDFRLATVD